MNGKWWLKAVTTCAVGVFAYGGSVFAAPVAVVTDMQGKATVQESKAVALLGEVEGDARVQLDQNARMVVVYYSTGAEYSLRGPSVVQFKAAGPESISGNAPEKRQAALASAGKE